MACSSEALPICNQTTHTCEACPASKASYSTSDHVCVACDSNSNYDKSSGKCVCKEGYGVVNNKCVDAGTAKIQGDAVSGCKSQACQSAKVFEFTTVQNMLYELTFEGTISYGDWAKFQCEGAILDTTSSSETNGKTTKQWCSDHKARDTNPDDTQYCSCASSDKSCKKCYNDGKGLENNKGCARGTITTSQDNVKFLGDGKKCTFTAVNGNGDCTAACAISDKGSISVVPLETSYTPSAQ